MHIFASQAALTQMGLNFGGALLAGGSAQDYLNLARTISIGLDKFHLEPERVVDSIRQDVDELDLNADFARY